MRGPVVMKVVGSSKVDKHRVDPLVSPPPPPLASRRRAVVDGKRDEREGREGVNRASVRLPTVRRGIERGRECTQRVNAGGSAI